MEILHSPRRIHPLKRATSNNAVKLRIWAKLFRYMIVLVDQTQKSRRSFGKRQTQNEHAIFFFICLHHSFIYFLLIKGFQHCTGARLIDCFDVKYV